MRPAIVWNIDIVPAGSLAIALVNAVWSKVIVPVFVSVMPIDAGLLPFTAAVAALSTWSFRARIPVSPVNTDPVVEVLLVPPLVLELVETAESVAIVEKNAMRLPVRVAAAFAALLVSGFTVIVAGVVVFADTVTFTPVMRPVKVLLLDEIVCSAPVPP